LLQCMPLVQSAWFLEMRARLKRQSENHLESLKLKRSFSALFLVMIAFALAWKVLQNTSPPAAPEESRESTRVAEPPAIPKDQQPTRAVEPQARVERNNEPRRTTPIKHISDELPKSPIEIEVKELTSRFRYSSSNELIAFLRNDLAALKSNNPPSVQEVKALLEELQTRFPQDVNLKFLTMTMDLDNQFGKAPRKLMESAQQLYDENPNHPAAGELLVYGMLALGFDNFKQRIGVVLNSNPNNVDFQYAAVAVDLANGDKQQAIDHLRYIVAAHPDYQKAITTLRKVGEGKTEVDEAMDFNPTMHSANAGMIDAIGR
jgi:hypothetical protein